MSTAAALSLFWALVAGIGCCGGMAFIQGIRTANEK